MTEIVHVTQGALIEDEKLGITATALGALVGVQDFTSGIAKLSVPVVLRTRDGLRLRVYVAAAGLAYAAIVGLVPPSIKGIVRGLSLRGIGDLCVGYRRSG